MARSRKPGVVPRTIAELQSLAGPIAAEFGNLECTACAREIARMLPRDADASFEILRPVDGSAVISLIDQDGQIATTGFHIGVRIGEKVFDNHHPEGVLASEWIGRFCGRYNVALRQISRPLSDFFGKQFLIKKFRLWVCTA